MDVALGADVEQLVGAQAWRSHLEKAASAHLRGSSPGGRAFRDAVKGVSSRTAALFGSCAWFGGTSRKVDSASGVPKRVIFAKSPVGF